MLQLHLHLGHRRPISRFGDRIGSALDQIGVLFDDVSWQVGLEHHGQMDIAYIRGALLHLPCF